ncbi:MAG: hypothetical protein MRECE_22c009 [Mycoplasmataceae bacterium CE_OT135]|nr:MAG: hypothetical protein MRECE_22c009 [Mycoplasmataceae bacterium CE_OT135]
MVGFFFFPRERERERNKEVQISNTNTEKQDKFQTNRKKSKIHYPKWLKIQKLSSGNYLVKWKYGERVETNNISKYEETYSENCLSFAEMPKFLAEHCAYWENNDWTNWEKELKDNYWLVKEWRQGEDGQIHHQTNYEFHPISETDQEEKEVEQRKEECKQRAKEFKERAEEIRKNAERIKKECEKGAAEARERAKKWKEKHKNNWQTCQKCGKKFCLGKEGAIRKTRTYKKNGEWGD